MQQTLVRSQIKSSTDDKMISQSIRLKAVIKIGKTGNTATVNLG